MQNRERQKRWRDRQRDGRIVLQVEVNERKVTAWLVNSSLLTENGSEDRAKIAAALAHAIELLIL
jgi:hypothetical protein